MKFHERLTGVLLLPTQLWRVLSFDKGIGSMIFNARGFIHGGAREGALRVLNNGNLSRD
jgi:hypothetical protein